MKTLSHVGALFALALSGGALSGCGASMFAGVGAGYDQQGCVEEALRRGADAATAKTAANEFELGCKTGDAAACSALGVVFETGVGRPQDARQARGLYAKACSAKNQRGCVNLAKLEIASAQGAGDLALAHERLFLACELGEPSGCAAMGERLRRGAGVPRDLEKADRMLDRGCAAGNAEACYALGDLREVDEASPAHNQAAITLFVKSCVAGHEPACRRLSPSARVAAR